MLAGTTRPKGMEEENKTELVSNRLYGSPRALRLDVVAVLVLGCLQSSVDRIERDNCD